MVENPCHREKSYVTIDNLYNAAHDWIDPNYDENLDEDDEDEDQFGQLHIVEEAGDTQLHSALRRFFVFANISFFRGVVL